MTKLKTITLAHGLPNPHREGTFDYRVEKVTDSVEFAPRQVMTTNEVHELCQAKDWRVTIIKLGD